MIIRSFLRFMLGCLIAFASVQFQTRTAHAQTFELARTGLVYVLGRVDRVDSGSAKIDLGDVHTLRPGERVAIIRPFENYYIPIGVVHIAETNSTYCRAAKSTGVRPAPGDIAIFVREFSQLKTAEQHLENFVKHRLVKDAGKNRYSTFGNADVAIALANYRVQYTRWERSKRDVIGYLGGRSFAGGKESAIEPLLSQLDMMRESMRDGRASLPAAGNHWVSVMTVIAGATATAQLNSAMEVKVEDEFAEDDESGPTIRDIRRLVHDTLFDRLDEEIHLVSYLVASYLDASKANAVEGSFELWFTHRLKTSQFPGMAEEIGVIDNIDRILQILRDDDF